MIHHSENILVILDSIPSMNELVSLCMKINEFSTNINHVFFFLKSQKGGLITFCWAQDMTVVVVNVCGLSQLCHFTPDSFFYRCLPCLKQHQAQLANIPDMYLLSTLDDTIVISWLANCNLRKIMFALSALI